MALRTRGAQASCSSNAPDQPARRTFVTGCRTARAGSLRAGVACALLLCVASVTASAQSIGRDAYHRHLPPMGRIVAQTDASARLHLYGDASDPAYRDVLPVDGIDDARGRHLLGIATRFAPILRRNNFSVPRHFTAVFGGRPVLQVDTWTRGRLVRSDSILLFQPAPAGESDGVHPEDVVENVHSDSLLLRLLETDHPFVDGERIERAEGEEETIAFFDFPGADEKSWRSAYRDVNDRGIYAHLFIHEYPASEGETRYALVVQYWFFYPFNDGVNNHEGDWEHLAVLISTPEAAAREPGAAGLTGREMARILDPGGNLTDSLVIREVEYYFHESVVVVDYLVAPAPPSSRWQELKHLHVWEQPDYIDNVVQERRRALDGRLATHPIGYIGGNNKGPDELTNLWPRFQGSFNRNGHGTYPFAGAWLHVGPLGATEQLSGRAVPAVRTDLGAAADTLPLEALFEDDHFMAFEAHEILLVPDWERIAGLVLEQPAARRDWSWLLLPVRWGYPASVSFGAGAVEHVDVGQIAPEGPAFQPTWNRIAADGGFRVYRPRVQRALFAPMTPWDHLSSGWGFLNIPKALLGILPGWNVAMAQVGPWLTGPLEAVGLPPSKTFAPERRPYRFSSFGLGWHRQYGGSGFARLLPQPGDAVLADPDGAAAAAAGALPAGLAHHEASGMRAWLTLHYGPRFSVQNTFARSTSSLGYDAVASDNSAGGRVQGTLAMKEITGGFRYRVLSGFGDATQLFAGAGWGWTWYNLENVAFRGVPIEFERKGGYGVSILPSARWWPNTWYGMVGLELLAPRDAWFADRVGYGLQLEYTGLLHRLGPRRPGGDGALGSVTRRELAVAAVVSW